MNRNSPLAVLAGTRTPFAKSFTTLSSVPAVELGRIAVTELLKTTDLRGDEIDEVIMGNVSGPPDAANIARVISLLSGIPHDRIAHTVNRNCGSGMESILAGWHAINEGRSKLVVAGGTESMSQVPLLLSPQAQAVWMQLARSKTLGQKLGTLASFRPRHFKPVSALELGLTDPVCGLNMGQTAELLAHEFNITRSEQDEFALQSHLKAETAQQQCFLSGERVSVPITGGNTIDSDNGIRQGQSMEQLAKLRPIFQRNGTVTAGNSCPLTDGAAAMVLASPQHAERLDSPPLGYITDYAIAGCAPDHMGLGPVHATVKLLKKTGLSLQDFDLVEINEAFAAQVIACRKAFDSKSYAQREFGMAGAVGELRPEITNVHGGAIALGHPVGTTGTRLILTLLRSLRASGLRLGLATLCIGGGQGLSMVVETELEKER